jgi:hypothetical protein
LLPWKSVTLIGATCLTTGWLLASMLTPPVALVQTLREGPATPPRATAAPAAFTEQLRLRLQDAPDPPTSRRNPFVFGRRERPLPAASVATEATPIVDPAPIAPLGPIYELSGIGVTNDERTAIISDGNSVLLAKVGATVGRYQVLEITDTSVTLLSATDQRQLILRLR